jgi:hypothetical protein
MSSEKNSELSEYSEWPRKKIRNCPNTPNDLGKKFGIKKFIQNFCPNVVLKLFNKCSLGIFSRYSSEFFSEWSSEFFSEWSSEIAPKVAKLMRKFSLSSEKNSELSEYSEWPRKKIRNCPNTPNDLGKKFGIYLGIVRILRMTSEKNSEFRIKVGNYHPFFWFYGNLYRIFVRM